MSVPIPRQVLQHLIFDQGGRRRFTQDSPVMPDVWFGFGEEPDRPLNLLLEPRRGVAPATLAGALRKAAGEGHAGRIGEVAHNESYVAARLDLDWLVRLLGPLLGARTRKRPVRSPGDLPKPSAWSDRLAGLLRGLPAPRGRGARAQALLWAVNRNRRAFPAIYDSSKTIKADAATRLFSLNCDHLA